MPESTKTALRYIGLTIMVWIAGVLLVRSAGKSDENLSVLTGQAEFRSIRKMLPDSLKSIAFTHLAEREKRIADLTTLAGIVARQRFIRESVLRSIGGLPAATPLNPKITGVLKRSGYRI